MLTKRLFIVGALAIMIAGMLSASAQAWQSSLGAWQFREKLTFNHTGATLNNFPVLVKLTPARINYQHVKPDCSDLRFVDSDDATMLPYEVEFCNPHGVTSVWVKVPSLSAGSDFIWFYYGNPVAQRAEQPQQVWTEYLTVFHLNESSGGTAYDSSPNQLNATVSGDPQRGPEHGFIGPGYHVRFEDQICLNQYAQNTAPFNEGTYSLMLRRDWSDLLTGKDNSVPFGYYQIGGMYSGWYIPPGGTINDGCDAGLEFFWNYVDQQFRDSDLFDPNNPNQWDNFNVLFTNGCNPNKDANFYRDINDEHKAVPQDTWTLLTLTWSDAQGQFRFYANGSLVYQERWSPVGPANTPLNYWAVIGNPYCGEYQGMVGNADEVRYANEAKSSDWIMADGKSLLDKLINFGAEEKKF